VIPAARCVAQRHRCDSCRSARTDQRAEVNAQREKQRMRNLAGLHRIAVAAARTQELDRARLR
jgi:transposase-like protein